MMNKLKSDYISWILLIGLVMLFLEISFFNKGIIFSLLVASGMIYFGRKMMPKTFGTLLFWAGLIFFAASILGMITFRFFLLAILIHFIIQFSQSKRHPEKIIPVIKVNEKPSQGDKTIIKRKPVLENIFFGQQRTPERVYEWNDINIQAGIGDTIIDLSYTVLPKGETVIVIRNMIGNVQVLVPYDLEVSVNHSSLAGSATIFDHKEEKIFNQNLHIQTPEYDNQEQKVKIFTSFIVGELEVKRV
ncbi:cell wall-active antibiotics response protein LiaF [Bacillus methanolicus]|uniref:Cell wall-active antibiotics response protein n=1 Tax=Bacillus methanolicus (strain MGA3 / ATCC 53907) TaxID=796606 RepID=I3E2V7_BACMM|nr:cell wall-active antibiotics response protein LiaF [Bacillus methanolicus]AIE59075.1 Cell wall-active antibiotics response protein [Bacillus methanolicus MGA3]EIJ80828.1 Cell wall-active antibiotics response protein [Bacillus methanolicus MGA3]